MAAEATRLKRKGLKAGLMIARGKASLRATPSSQENAALNVTALQAETLLSNLTTARLNFDALKGGCRTDRNDRDGKVRAMRRRISGLIHELDQEIPPLDPRWLDFGLNLPGAASVSKAPQNVAATPTMRGSCRCRAMRR